MARTHGASKGIRRGQLSRILSAFAAACLGVHLLLTQLAARTSFVGVSGVAARRLHHVALGAARRFFIGGNWKANGNPGMVKELIADLNAGQLEVDASRDVQVVCAPPFVFLSEVKNTLRKDFAVAAQNMWDKAPGAWTGETPAQMLKDVGLEWVILGHSERRENCGETSQVVAQKTKFAVDNGLSTITCIGEKLDEREGGKTFSVLDEQMRPIAAMLKEADWDKVVLAYEPVWAIGTGKVATPEQAEEVHAYLRKWLLDNVSQKVSDSVRILYGGSVNEKNSEELGKKPNIDGFLVGGASLKGSSFTTIINSAKLLINAGDAMEPSHGSDAGRPVGSEAIMPDRISRILEFASIVGKLKEVKRTGWVRSGVTGAESVADHMYRMALLSFALGPAEGVNSGKCIKMALVHDLGESLIGDLVTDGDKTDPITKEDKQKKEREAIDLISSTVGDLVGQEIKSLWEEFEAGETPEARHLKDLDRFEMVLQASEYEETQRTSLPDFFRTTEGKFGTPLFKALDAEVRKRRADRPLVGEGDAKRPKPVTA